MDSTWHWRVLRAPAGDHCWERGPNSRCLRPDSHLGGDRVRRLDEQGRWPTQTNLRRVDRPSDEPARQRALVCGRSGTAITDHPRGGRDEPNLGSGRLELRPRAASVLDNPSCRIADRFRQGPRRPGRRSADRPRAGRRGNADHSVRAAYRNVRSNAYADRAVDRRDVTANVAPCVAQRGMSGRSNASVRRGRVGRIGRQSTGPRR